MSTAAATLASMASHEATAGFIIAAPNDSVAGAVLALLEVEDDPGFSNAGENEKLCPLAANLRLYKLGAVMFDWHLQSTSLMVCTATPGHVRAAASTCLAFLSCHPLGASGDACLAGPFRQRLLAVGAFGALLRAALASTGDDPCDAIIQQTAAVGVMYLSTMVRH